MRRFSVILFFFTCVVVVSSCSSKRHETNIKVQFSNCIWNRFEPMDTVFTISNIKKAYDVTVELSVLNGFEHSRIPIEIVITSPSGQQNILNKVLVMKDEQDNHIGKVYGDTWTVQQIIYSHKEFTEEGKYSVTIQNRTQYYDLPKVESLSFIITPSKKK